METFGHVRCFECGDRIGRDRAGRGRIGQRAAVGPHELEPAVGRPADPGPTLVNRAVMSATEEHQVAERGGAALGPVLDMVAFPQA